MKNYKTSEVAKVFGIHPNTVRLYEEWNLIPRAERTSNGYRVFTEFHIEQLKLVRLALKTEIIQNGLRKQIVEVVKASAVMDFDKALLLASDYMVKIKKEQVYAEEAIVLVKEILSRKPVKTHSALKRKEASVLLNISVDTLRNWEMNGLLKVKRKENGYRIYSDEDFKRLKIIRSLRCANYSLEAILRMLHELDCNPETNIKQVLDTPKIDDTIISACDKLISSLEEAENNAKIIYNSLLKIKNKFKPSTIPPTF